MLELFHTSPNAIKEINDRGRFGSFLFFSSNVYHTHCRAESFVYKIEIDEDEIVSARQIFRHHEINDVLQSIIDDVMDRYGVDEDVAMGLIDEDENIYDYIDDPEEAAEESWNVQLYTASAAQALGYRGVAVSDEQGTAYMIDMIERKKELKLFK